VSQSNLQLMRDRFNLPADIGEVIYNGRSAAYFAQRDWQRRSYLRKSLAIPMEATVALTTARLMPEKGYCHQIETIKRLRQTPLWGQLYFVWVGTGQTEAALKQSVEQIGAGAQVKFLGERSDIPDLLDAADIFVLPSRFEGMPLSIMEAMAKELPVVATAISGIPEELAQTGVLLSDPNIDTEKTVSGLVEALETLSVDRDRREALGKAAKRRAEHFFTEERMVASYLQLIQQVVPELPLTNYP
ncbi:glycosyltransferase family 4 protein, partial [cf. Phormidesmis sp. LEGE 11477]|uniref:glycosyltransferase family 4 protein n=1 Tax=cf. Phormidesmis sp. LEGE 11477 TaxID=1828680 RepID=UPI00188128B0